MLMLTSPEMNLCRSILLTPSFFSNADARLPREQLLELGLHHSHRGGNTKKAHVKPLSLERWSGLRASDLLFL